MNVWAIAMVKDEADVIREVLRHVAAQGVTGILIADNMSSDGTRQMIDSYCVAGSLGCELLLVDDEEVGYWQSMKMTALANEAHANLGADWIWPFDADELWYYGDSQPLCETIAQRGNNGDVIHARLWHHFRTAVDDPSSLNPFTAMHYRSAEEAPIGKVIVRWRDGCVLEAGNHAVSYHGDGEWCSSSLLDVQVRHFPYRSPEQFIRKAINGAAAYASTSLPYSTGQHWREYGIHYENGGEDALRRIFEEHFVHDLPSASGLVYDPARLDG